MSAFTLTETRRTGYGLWWATVRDGAGREFTGGGRSESEAAYRARLAAARERCGGCGREGALGAAEARLSRRILGPALCHACREADRRERYGPAFGED